MPEDSEELKIKQKIIDMMVETAYPAIAQYPKSEKLALGLHMKDMLYSANSLAGQEAIPFRNQHSVRFELPRVFQGDMPVKELFAAGRCFGGAHSFFLPKQGWVPSFHCCSSSLN